ncbi:MAG TPA: glycosyltransferase family 2 protein [Candidatus Saccharimonadales bacterium]|nr:glycosyltransferase family 2 protein [Candidatus Saccharimonadales bacterium]
MSHKKPLTLSIVIPVYNEENHLRACLDSIAAQTVKPDEVIVVDNNSRDKSIEIAKSYSFVTILNESRQGIVYARTKGFDHVTNDIIARIDGDSILPHNWVSRIQHFYGHDKHQNYGITGGAYFYNFRMPRLNGWIMGQLAYRLNRFITGFYILWGSNMAIPTKLWKEVRPQICMRDDIHEDLDLAIHLNKLGYKTRYQENLRVGVALKRIWTDRKSVHKHMERWPLSLKIHGFKLWWLGSVGNFFLWYVLQPFFISAEYIAEFFGKQSLK